jgi:DNA-binding CsgD family transcriptional regulator
MSMLPSRCLIGPAALGLMSKSKICVGNHKVAHAFGISTTPLMWPCTPRETEVLSWVAKGKANRDVGEILGLSPRTVNKHLEHVFEKLGVETRAAAAALASRELDR